MLNIVETNIKHSKKFYIVSIILNLTTLLSNLVSILLKLKSSSCLFLSRNLKFWRFSDFFLEFEKAIDLFIQHSDEEEENVLKSLTAKLSHDEDVKLAHSFVKVRQFRSYVFHRYTDYFGEKG